VDGDHDELLAARQLATELAERERRVHASLRTAEARLRLALDSARLFVWEAGLPAGDRVYESGVARLLGHAEARPVDAAAFAAAIDPADRAAEAAAFAAAAADGAYACVYRLNGVDGIARTVSSTGRGLRDDDDRLVGLVGVLQDVTAQSRERAEADDRALFAEQMLGIVSHDLRNPLSTIVMSVVTLQHSGLAPRQQSAVERIERAAQRSTAMIEDLLDFTVARIGSGLPMAPAPIDLHGIVATGLDDLRHAFPGHALEHVASGRGECSGDAARLTQLLGNLVANAVTHGAPARPIRVTSTLEGATFSLSVHNEGAAIDAETLASMFEPMQQGKRVARAHGGVGLGLYIVRQIALAHGGDVTVRSTAEEGTTFTARLRSA
jgi:sigma-B regulation protein RsbU (phosphoserine phosphatase)